MLGSVLRVLRVLVGSLTCLDGVSEHACPRHAK